MCSSDLAVVFHPFLALKARVVTPPTLEEGELLESLELPLTEVYALLAKGEIQDASTASPSSTRNLT